MSGNKDMIEVTIIKWDHYQPRKDIKVNSWFRLNNNLFEDSDFFDFSCQEMMAWIYLLSLASKKNSCTFCLNFNHVNKIGRIKSNDMISALDKLECYSIVKLSTLRPRTYTLRPRTDTCTTNKQTNKQTPQDHVHVIERDKLLEKTYAMYPRKIGKKLGMQRLKKEIKTKKQLSDLNTAIENYRDYCNEKNVDEKFIKHFSSFANCWTDWIEVEKEKTPREINEERNWIY